MIWIVGGLVAAWLLFGRKRVDPAAVRTQVAKAADASGQGTLPYGTHAALARDMSPDTFRALTAAVRGADGGDSEDSEIEVQVGYGDYGSPGGRGPFGGFGSV